jgi:hypothetical protein
MSCPRTNALDLRCHDAIGDWEHGAGCHDAIGDWEHGAGSGWFISSSSHSSPVTGRDDARAQARLASTAQKLPLRPGGVPAWPVDTSGTIFLQD